MKKIKFIIFLLLICFAMIGCDNDNTTVDTTMTTEEITSTTQTTTQTTTEEVTSTTQTTTQTTTEEVTSTTQTTSQPTTQTTIETTVMHTVIFYDWDGSVLGTVEVEDGGNILNMASPLRTGYTFIGWDHDLSEITASLTITAQYEINRYTVTFIDYDDTVLKIDEVDYLTSAYAPSVPARVGYTFTGWDIAFNEVTEDITVTAQYTINQYTVTFNDYDGTLLSVVTVDYGTAAVILTPTREHYTFTGWSENINNVTDNITVIAQYTINQYTVTFNTNGGTVIDPITVDYGTVIDIPNDPEKVDNYFIHWEDTEEITSDTYTVIEDVTITAIWEDTMVNFHYYEESFGIVITGITNSMYFGELIIPDTYGGEPITKIADYAFLNSEYLFKLTIGSNVNYIGHYSFQSCDSLEEVVFKDASKLNTIGLFAFNGCDFLEIIDLSDAQELYIFQGAFSGCYFLRAVYIPATEVMIAADVFKTCDNLTIYLEGSTEGTFWGSTWNPNWNPDNRSIEYNVTGLYSNEDCAYAIINNQIIYILSNQGYNVTIPNTIEGLPVVKIQDFAFISSYITTVYIPENIEVIGIKAFYYCNNLTTVTISTNNSNLGEIGANAFRDCTSLTSINLIDCQSLYTISDYAFSNTGLHSIIIPYLVTEMGANVFYQSSNISIECEAPSLPSMWDTDWNINNYPVTWGYVSS